MAKKKSRSYYRRRKRKIMAILRIAAVALVVIAIVVVAVVIIVNHNASSAPKTQVIVDDNGETTEVEVNTETGYAPGPPSPAVVSTASVGATGDILLHNSVLNGALQDDGSYDFSASFTDIAAYWSAYDYMIVNLEVPCGGDDDPTGYPVFDAPDSIVTALKDAGVDMCLTATNHAYDCRTTGLTHTQELLNEEGLDHVGTRLSEDESYVLIKDINGIKFGFACYTYDTRSDPDEDKSLNGIAMDADAADLVNSFCYSDLDSLYASVSEDLKTMDSAGCDVTVFFMHWGDEYTDYPNSYEEEISQEMCNLGVDMIVGGHPHVIQEFDVLNGSSGNTTYCLYSMGNAISSQRRDVMNEDDYRGYTEDGLVFSFTYEKLNNGKVKLTGVDVLPTWVEVGNNGTYYIDPLDPSLSSDAWPVGSTAYGVESYNRTMGRIGDAYPALRAELGQSEVPASVE